MILSVAGYAAGISFAGKVNRDTSGGVMFDADDKIVIYEYASEESLDKARKDYEIIKDWDSNGRFLLETSNEKATEIFNSVE